MSDPFPSTPMLRSAALLFALAFAGCASPGTALDTPAAPAVPDGAPAVPRIAPATPATHAVLLDGEGLRLVQMDTGSTRLVEFGTSEAVAVSVVRRVRRAAPSRSEGSECGAGPMQFATWPDGFAMHFQDDAFVGWAQGGGGDEAATLTTMTGLGIGTSRADLDDGPTVATVEETTLGAEFQTAGLSGLLSGLGPDGRVDYLWAGVACNFR